MSSIEIFSDVTEGAITHSTSNNVKINDTIYKKLIIFK